MAKIQLQSFYHSLRGLLTLLTGVFLLLMPGLTLETAIMVIGAMLMANGLITLFLTNRRIKIRGFFSLQGLFNIVIGLAFLLAPTASLKFFVVILGLILLLFGTVQLVGAIAVFSWRRWPLLYFIFALLMVSGGLLLLYNPFKSLEAIVSFIGFLLILYGLSQMMSVKMKRKKDYHNGSPIQDIPHEEL